MTDDEITVLEALAQAATPGPWEREGMIVWCPDAKAIIAGASAPEPKSGFIEYEKPSIHNLAHPGHNAAYIAAANPAAILALIRRLREAEADAERFRWLVEGRGAHYSRTGGGYSSSIAWLHHSNAAGIRAAIDDAMGGEV